MPAYPVAYRRGATAPLPRGPQPGLPRRPVGPRRRPYRRPGLPSLGPRVGPSIRQSAIDVATIGAAVYFGSDPLGDAAGIYAEWVNGTHPAAWRSFWRETCANDPFNHCPPATYTGVLRWVAAGNCTACNQAVSGNDMSQNPLPGHGTVSVGRQRWTFSSLRLNFGWTYVRTVAGDVPAPNPLVLTEPNAFPWPLPSPVEYPARYPSPEIYPPRPMPRTQPAPRPRPGEQPSEEPDPSRRRRRLPRPRTLPRFPRPWGRVFTPGENIPPDVVPPPQEYVISPPTAGEPPGTPGWYEPAPSRPPRMTPGRPPKATKESKLNVRAAKFATMWLVADSAWAVDELVRNLEKTLPQEYRLPDYMEDGKKPTPYDIAWNVYNNWEHISVELAVETWINEYIEDAAYGRLDAGKPLNQLTGQLTGGSRATSTELPVPKIDIDVDEFRLRIIWPDGPNVLR